MSIDKRRINLGYDILDPCRVKVCDMKGKEEGEEGRLRFHPRPKDRGLPTPPPSPPQVKNGVLKMEFTVMIRRAGEGGFWAEVPALPGCYSQGETFEETLENIREAIEGHMEALQQEGQGVPPEEDLIIGKVRVSESFA